MLKYDSGLAVLRLSCCIRSGRPEGWTQDEAYCGGRWEEGRAAEPVDADAMQRLLDAVQSACSDTIMQTAPRVLRAANRGALTPCACAQLRSC